MYRSEMRGPDSIVNDWAMKGWEWLLSTTFPSFIMRKLDFVWDVVLRLVVLRTDKEVTVLSPAKV